MADDSFVCIPVPRAPEGVKVERVNNTHMRVAWTPLTPASARGHILYYTVYYWPASDRQRVRSRNTTGSSVTVGGLVSGEDYVIQVSATTGAGGGPNSSQVTLFFPNSGTLMDVFINCCNAYLLILSVVFLQEDRHLLQVLQWQELLWLLLL